MKKLLNISVIAALAILPMAANADITTTDPGATNADAPVAANAPKYSLATADTTDANLATAGYVKGAYNATIKAINKVATTAANAANQDLSNLSATGKANVSAQGTYNASTNYTEGTVGAAIKSKADAATTYTKTEVDTALGNKADAATTYTKTQVDTALAGKQNTLTTAQQNAVDSGITAAKVADYDQLVTDSANYATKTGVLATINASTVPVMAQWGSTTPTTVSVDAPANFVNQ